MAKIIPTQRFFPAGIVHFTDTDTYHYVAFSYAPRQKDDVANGPVRFRSTQYSERAWKSKSDLSEYLRRIHKYIYLGMLWKMKSDEFRELSTYCSPDVF